MKRSISGARILITGASQGIGRALAELAAARGITYATGQAFHALNEDVPYLRLAFGWIDKDDIAEGVRALADCVREAMPSRV